MLLRVLLATRNGVLFRDEFHCVQWAFVASKKKFRITALVNLILQGMFWEKLRTEIYFSMYPFALGGDIKQNNLSAVSFRLANLSFSLNISFLEVLSSFCNFFCRCCSTSFELSLIRFLSFKMPKMACTALPWRSYIYGCSLKKERERESLRYKGVFSGIFSTRMM